MNHSHYITLFLQYGTTTLSKGNGVEHAFSLATLASDVATCILPMLSYSQCIPVGNQKLADDEYHLYVQHDELAGKSTQKGLSKKPRAPEL